MRGRPGAGISPETLSMAIRPFVILPILVLLFFRYLPAISRVVPKIFNFV
jgi:hypothetical protein